MCAPMSPSAPEPARSFCSRQVSGRAGSTSQSCRYCGAHVPDLAEPPVGDQLAGERDGRHPAVGEADHRADAALRPPRSAAAAIASASATVLASGFSHSTCLPASSAAIAISAWRVARGADVDEVDVVPGDHRAPVGLGRRPADLRAAAATPAASRPHDAAISGCERQVEEAGRDAPGLGVRRAHEGVADHGDAEARRGVRIHAMSSVGRCGVGRGRPPDRGRPATDRQVLEARSMYWSTLSFVTTGASSTIRFGTPGCDQVAHRLALRDEARQRDAVGGLRRRVDDRRLEHRVVGLDGLHRVLASRRRPS